MKPVSTTEMSAIVDDEAPKLTQADVDRARFRVAGKPVSREAWQAAVARAHGMISLAPDVRSFFAAKAPEGDMSALINATLRQVMAGEMREA